jgi:hypothetical protein
MDRPGSGAWLPARLACVAIKEMNSIAGLGGRRLGESSLGQSSSFVQVIARAHLAMSGVYPKRRACTLPDEGRRT